MSVIRAGISSADANIVVVFDSLEMCVVYITPFD